jgi:3-oxoacyl-[acyl-carrier protein] reductase
MRASLACAMDEFKLPDFDRTFAINVRLSLSPLRRGKAHEGRRAHYQYRSTNAERMPFPGGGVYA